MAALAVQGKPTSPKYQTGSFSEDRWVCSSCCVMLNSPVPQAELGLELVLAAADGENASILEVRCSSTLFFLRFPSR